MSKVQDTPTQSNVQGEPVVGRVLINVPIDKIIVDPNRPNIRGHIVDTTDLQESIRENGIMVPLQVRFAPEPGYFYRITGNRRQVAARAVGLTHVPVVLNENVTEREVRRMMLMSDLHKAEPHIVLNQNDEVIAGKCKAVYDEIMDNEYGVSRQDLAASMGVSSDVIGAYVCLYSDIPEIQHKVARGQMAITVYSLIKHHGLEIKKFLAAKRGNVSANYVRNALRDWDAILNRLGKAAEDSDDSVADATVETRADGEDRVKFVIKKKMTVKQLLGGAADNLNRIALSESALSGTDWAIVEQIERLIERIKNANG